MSASCTAQITVGHVAWGVFGGLDVGLGPTHALYLVEGSRAAWVLEAVTHSSGGADAFREPITWVASRPERILNDGLLMIATLVAEDPTARDRVASLEDRTTSRAMLEESYADLTRLDKGAQGALSGVARLLPRGIKLIVAPFDGSSITRQLGALRDGEFMAEVCLPAWSRIAAADGELRALGDLPPDDPDSHRFKAIRV